MSGDKSDRYVVLVGRRYFSPEQKRAIVAEATGIGVNVSAVARAHDIKPSFDQVAATTTENEQMAGVRIGLQSLLHE